MIRFIENFRSFLLCLYKKVPDSLRVIDSTKIENLPRRVLAVLLAISVVSSTGAVALPIWDADGDGMLNGEELVAGTNWQSIDTDSDGLSDSREHHSVELNATNPDTDQDGLNDSKEAEIGSNASRAHTDQDGLNDSEEVSYGTDPTANDTDGDSLSDLDELNGTTSPVKADTDNDGLNDGKELNIGSNATKKDTDSDLLPDKREWNLNTSLTSWDTDNDSLSDLREAMSNRLNPRKADTDSDGINDSRELQMATIVNVSDTDKDKLEDGAELDNGTSPVLPDTDNDSLQDGEEVFTYRSNPLNEDTDFDNVSDSLEVNHDVLNATDPDVDGDGLKDGVEWYGKTNVTLADTDGDGLDDWNETKTLSTDPIDNDTDSDGLLDGNETYRFVTDPLDPDTDGDELKDGAEKQEYGTNATNPDTDSDTLTDAEEVNEYETDPLKKDTDGDGLTDKREVKVLGTNATNNDTDGDGIPDGTEVAVKSYDPKSPNQLHNKSASLSVSASQANVLGEFIDTLVRVAQSVVEDDPNAGVLREYSQAINASPDIDVSGSEMAALKNFKQAGLYQILDLIQEDIGVGISSKALKGRLQQAISIGARINSVVAVISDYSQLHDQAEKLVDENRSNDQAAKMGVIIATTVLVIDAYLLYQTGGTFSLASGHKLAFRGTGTIAAKTKLARLAKYCGWKCVGGVERLLHWSLRSFIDIGETKLVGAVIQIGYFNVTGVSIVDVLEGLSDEQLKELLSIVNRMADEVLPDDVLATTIEAIRNLIAEKGDDWLSLSRTTPKITNERSLNAIVHSSIIS